MDGHVERIIEIYVDISTGNTEKYDNRSIFRREDTGKCFDWVSPKTLPMGKNRGEKHIRK